MPCGQCNNPSLCEYCNGKGQLDEQGKIKLKRIVEGRKIVEQSMKQSTMAEYSCRS